MARLRVNNLQDPTGSTSPITLATAATTTCTWSTAPANMPTVAAPDYLPLTVEQGTPNEEIIWVTAYTAGQTSGTCLRNREGSTAAAHTNAGWVHGPSILDFIPQPPVVLYSVPSTFKWSSYHQSKIKILGDTTANPVCGTFVAQSSTVAIDVEVSGVNQGGSWAPLALMIGTTASGPTVPLFSPLTYPVSAAAGVSNFQELQCGRFTPESDGTQRTRVVITGLTAGTTYTWQLTTAIESAAASDVLPYDLQYGTLALSPDKNWAWITMYGNNCVVPVRLGARPGWRYGSNGSLPQFLSVVGNPIPVGNGPTWCAVSPDGLKVAVANYTDGTITFISTQTFQVIGTSAVLLAGANVQALDWVDDSSAVVAAAYTGSNQGWYAVTCAATPVVTTLAGWGNVNITGLYKAGTGNGFFFTVPTYIGTFTMTSNTVMGGTVPTVIPSGMTNSHRACVDANKNLWVPIDGGTYNQQVIKIPFASTGSLSISQAVTPHSGQSIYWAATTADGQEVWWASADNMVGAFQTSDGGQTQSPVAASGFQPSGATSPYIRTIVESGDGYIYVISDATAGGTHSLWEWQGATLLIDMTSSQFPAGHGILVTAEGATLT